jgi:hypothetical protein
MKVKKVVNDNQLVSAFYLVVDGDIRFGPYISRSQDHIDDLLRLKGITTLPVVVRKKDLAKAKRGRIDVGEKQPGLLDGLDWIPITMLDPTGWKEEE